MLEDVTCAESGNIFGDLYHALRENVSFVGNIQVEFNVGRVLLANLRVHLDVVVHFCLFVLIGVQQVFFAFEVLIDFAVHFNVLEPTVEDDENLSVDGPVVEVADVALEDEF